MSFSDPDLAMTLKSLPTSAADLMLFLSDHDLLALTIPREHGGRGAPMSDGVSLAFELGRRSGSAGLTFAMHLSQLHTWAAHVKGSTYLAQELASLVASSRLVASVVSEPETGGNIHRATAVMGLTELTKETSNTSYVPQSGAFLVTAMDHSGPKPVQRLVMVRADATDAVQKRVNHLMGFKDIDNRAWSFTFRYPPEAVFAEPFATIASSTMTAATHLLWAGLWSGLASRALDTSARFVKNELPPDIAAQIQPQLSALRNSKYVLNALIRDNLRPPTSPFATAAALNRLKIVSSENARDIALACLQIIGLRAYAEGGPYSLSEVIRDVLSGPIMVANARLQANTAGIDRFSEERP